MDDFSVWVVYVCVCVCIVDCKIDVCCVEMFMVFHDL